MGALDLSYLGVTIEFMEGPTAPIIGVSVQHNVLFSHFTLLKTFWRENNEICSTSELNIPLDHWIRIKTLTSGNHKSCSELN